MDLIDREALRKEINKYALPYKDNRLESANDMFYRIIHLLDDAPTVDAEPVVRCKDCRWFKTISGEWGYCTTIEDSDAWHYDNYCSYAVCKE